MKEETTIAFKEQTGFKIAKANFTTGKIIINNIEITSIEDWNKVIRSINDLQSQLKAKEEVIKEALDKIETLRMEKWAIMGTDIMDIMEILSKGENK